MNEITLGLVQMPVSVVKKENHACARRMITEAAKQGAELIVLPEMWNTPYNTAVFRDYAEVEGGASWQMLSDLARELGVHIVGGSIAELDDEERVYNTAFVFDSQGRQIAKHRKWHLFDIDVDGGQSFKESEVLSPGDGATIFDALGWRIGLGICFDIRFPVQAEAMAKEGVEMVIYPGAFNPTTGPLHWELLFRARAMDLQAWSVGVAPARDPNSNYTSWANSLVVDPWGTVRTCLGISSSVQLLQVDRAVVQAVRTQIPIGRQVNL